MKKFFTISSIDNISEAARQFVANMGSSHVFAFYGEMGAGKTTFIKAICEELGVTDTVTSPTFAIVNEYQVMGDGCWVIDNSNSQHPTANTQHLIYHFDFYRIRRIEEAYDMGYEDYFYNPNAICFIEWPELIEQLLPVDAVRVTITVGPDGSRTVRMSTGGGR